MRFLPLLVIAGLGCGNNDEPTCQAMAAHVNKLLGEDAEARQLQKSFEQRCVEDRWSQGMRECLVKTTSTNSPKNCRMYLNDTQQQRWDGMLAAAAAATASELPQACALYETMVKRVQTCEALSRDLRAELAARLAAHQAEWAKLADKSSLASSCGSAMGALRTAAAACFK